MSIATRTRPDRSSEMDQFLARIGWVGAERRMLAGDASFRRYERVTYQNTIAVLMDAPPPWEDVRPFVAVTRQLAQFGVSVPGIIAADEESGFLLLEDLGDHSFTRLLKAEHERELSLYMAATDALLAIQAASREAGNALASALPPYDMAVYLREAALFAEWFLPQVVGMETAQTLREEYLRKLQVDSNVVKAHFLPTTKVRHVYQVRFAQFDYPDQLSMKNKRCHNRLNKVT